MEIDSQKKKTIEWAKLQPSSKSYIQILDLNFITLQHLEQPKTLI